MNIKRHEEGENGQEEKVFLTPNGILIEPIKDLIIDFITFKTFKDEQGSINYSATIFYTNGRTFQIRWEHQNNRGGTNTEHTL
jgi:hypothetical protein